MNPKAFCGGCFPLQRFVGDSICHIDIGFRDVHFHFNKAVSIDVDGGKWQIHDSSGTIVDESIDVLPSAPQHNRVHVILDRAVTKCDLDAPRSFALTFSSGHRLTIYANAEPYEPFSIQPDGIQI